MDMSRLSRFRPLVSLPLVVALVVFATRAVSGKELREGAPSALKEPVVHAELVNLPTFGRKRAPAHLVMDSLVGRSGDLRVRILESSETEFYPALDRQYGDVARRPGVRALEGVPSAEFAFITMAPWRQKLGSHLNGYHLGFWPAELRRTAASAENPIGFIEVTRDNADTQLSTHFKLRDFVTHDQSWVWPKYVVLREDLLDKLELVLDALQHSGVETRHVIVLSGFRSPQYNARGVGEGMARASRHQFGDAADIIIDANGDGRMDDLNMDGRVTFADLQVVDNAVQQVERRYPELVGGLGLYHEMGPSGPFAHIDVRGTRARWTNARRPGRTITSTGSVVSSPAAQSSGRCQAEGAMAVLCGNIR